VSASGSAAARYRSVSCLNSAARSGRRKVNSFGASRKFDGHCNGRVNRVNWAGAGSMGAGCKSGGKCPHLVGLLLTMKTD